jgi:hypothetical protein
LGEDGSFTCIADFTYPDAFGWNPDREQPFSICTAAWFRNDASTLSTELITSHKEAIKKLPFALSICIAVTSGVKLLLPSRLALGIMLPRNAFASVLPYLAPNLITFAAFDLRTIRIEPVFWRRTVVYAHPCFYFFCG